MPRQTFRQRQDKALSASVEQVSRSAILIPEQEGLFVPRAPTSAELFSTALDVLSTDDESQEIYYQFPKDPVEFMQEVLGIHLWSKQREIVYAVFRDRYISVASCHGIGKSFTTAAIMVTFLNLVRNSMALSTAPTGRQVEHVLWREIRNIYASAKRPLLGREPLTTRYDISEKWYGMGFKPQDQETDPMQGFHADDVLAVIDEAAGVAPAIVNGMRAAMTSRRAHFLMIGNPTSTAGPFFDSHHSQKHIYTGFTVSADMTPNWTGEKHPVEGASWDGLISKEWVEEMTDVFGEDSDFIQSRVHAKWVSHEDVLVPLYLIEEAEKRMWEQESGVWEAGVDVARQGRDRSALTIRNGSRVIGQWKLASGESFKTADHALSLVSEFAVVKGREVPVTFKVDETGIGSGVVDALKMRIRVNQLRHKVIGVNFGSQASDPEMYLNQRCEMYVDLAHRFRTENITLKYMKVKIEEDLKTELSDIRRDYDGRHTQPIIEKKEEFRKRHGRSPDFADSMALAFYIPPKPEPKTIGAISLGYADNSFGRM